MDGLPTVDVDYVLQILKDCDKVIGTTKSGDTMAYVLRGSAPIVKRMFLIRCVDTDKTQVTFNCAMAIAIKTKQIDPMKDWLKKHRNFQHG